MRSRKSAPKKRQKHKAFVFSGVSKVGERQNLTIYVSAADPKNFRGIVDMFVQGLGQSKPFVIKPRPHVEVKPREGEKPSLFSTADVYEPAKSADRPDLLQSIRNKIKSGYYNSENVIDDISHGFAQVLDQTT